MYDPIAYDLAATLHKDLARASSQPSQLMRHELRFARTSRKRRRGARRRPSFI